MSELVSPQPPWNPDQWPVVLAFLPVLALFIAWIRADADGYLCLCQTKRRSARIRNSASLTDWAVLYESALAVIEGTISELPDEVRAAAQSIPNILAEWSLEQTCSNALGLHYGFVPNTVSEGGRIVLHLRHLESYCARYRLDFEDQVKKTYLHELGHHLGWDEVDLKQRGLG